MLTDRLEITIDRRRLTRWLIVGVVAILILHFYWWTTDSLDLPGETLWRRLSNVDVETTFPTWLSSILHLTTAALLAIIARAADSYRRHWVFLAVIFLLFSIDEVAALHETLAAPVRFAFGLDGIFYYAWVLPALIAVVVLGIAYTRFLLELPAPIKQRVIVAAVLLIGGAVGLEMVAGTFAGTPARDGWPYFIVSTIEETMEMASAILMVDTLLLYLEERMPHVSLRIGAAAAR